MGSPHEFASVFKSTCLENGPFYCSFWEILMHPTDSRGTQGRNESGLSERVSLLLLQTSTPLYTRPNHGEAMLCFFLCQSVLCISRFVSHHIQQHFGLYMQVQRVLVRLIPQQGMEMSFQLWQVILRGWKQESPSQWLQSQTSCMPGALTMAIQMQPQSLVAPSFCHTSFLSSVSPAFFVFYSSFLYCIQNSP